jgi:hypothetical protein
MLQLSRYCKRVYDEDSSILKKSSIFVTLLNVYLHPRRGDNQNNNKSTATTTTTSPGGELANKEQQHPAQLEPALRLLSKYGSRMDANYVLEILPPLLTIQELQIFLDKSIRKSISWQNNHKVVKRVRTARMDQVDLFLVKLEGRRVKITDGRLCPLCHKRLGNSVIAIHSPG